jgi:hypothetical protein
MKKRSYTDTLRKEVIDYSEICNRSVEEITAHFSKRDDIEYCQSTFQQWLEDKDSFNSLESVQKGINALNSYMI